MLRVKICTYSGTKYFKGAHYVRALFTSKSFYSKRKTFLQRGSKVNVIAKSSLTLKKLLVNFVRMQNMQDTRCRCITCTRRGKRQCKPKKAIKRISLSMCGETYTAGKRCPLNDGSKKHLAVRCLGRNICVR